MDASDAMYQKAYELHHEAGDIAHAVELYREIQQRFPNSDAARRAATQLETIDEVSDAELERAYEDASSADTSRGAPPDDDLPGSTALRFVSVLFKILAVFNMLAGFITGLVATSDPQMGISGFVALLAGAVSALFCWAIADSIRVLLTIAENSRRAVALLESDRK